MFKHILFATDGSAASEHAAQLAVGLARVHGARLTALYVVDPYPYLGGAKPIRSVSRPTCRRRCNTPPPPTTRWRRCANRRPQSPSRRGSPRTWAASVGIVLSAKDVGADLIVVGSHGRTGVRPPDAGQRVASKVVAESAIPVLVAR
jgi:nucleotide-binding universal stress UspA family protein